METFLADLRALEDDEAIQDFGRRTILHGTPYVFDGKEADFYEFRKRSQQILISDSMRCLLPVQVSWGLVHTNKPSLVMSQILM